MPIRGRSVRRRAIGSRASLVAGRWSLQRRPNRTAMSTGSRAKCVGSITLAGLAEASDFLFFASFFVPSSAQTTNRSQSLPRTGNRAPAERVAICHLPRKGRPAHSLLVSRALAGHLLGQVEVRYRNRLTLDRLMRAATSV